MSWYNPTTWDSDDIKRGALAVGTMGASELPVVGHYYRDGLDAVEGLANDALGKAKPPAGSITPEEWRAQRAAALAGYGAAGNRIDDAYGMVQDDRRRAASGPGSQEIRQTTPITLSNVGGHDVHAQTDGRFYDPGEVERVQSHQVQRPDDVTMTPTGALHEVTDTRLAPAQQANTTDVGRAVIDTGQANQIRGRQTANLDRLEKAAAGQGPSVAQEQLKGALASSAQQALGAAAAARGSERAGARREAILGIADKGQQIAANSAALRAQEIADASKQLTGALGETRGQDASTATEQAHIDASRNTTAAQIEAARQAGNAGEVNRLTALQGQLTSSAKQLNATAGNERDEFSSKLGTDTANQNAERGLRAGQQDAAAANAAAALNANSANTRASEVAAGRTANEQSNLNRGERVATGNADRSQAADVESARQWMEGQKITNDQGVARDVAEGNRKIGEYGATENATQHATGQGLTAAQLTLQQVQAMSTFELSSMAAQGSAAAQQELARRQAQTAALGVGTRIAAAVGTGGASEAANFGANNAPSVYGGNTVAF